MENQKWHATDVDVEPSPGLSVIAMIVRTKFSFREVLFQRQIKVYGTVDQNAHEVSVNPTYPSP